MYGIRPTCASTQEGWDEMVGDDVRFIHNEVSEEVMLVRIPAATGSRGGERRRTEGNRHKR